MKQAHPDAGMSGENPCETAIDLLDGFLYAYTVTPLTVPMFASVYGDYIVRYGMTLDRKSEVFYTQCATLFTEGAQMGRLSVAPRDKSADARKAFDPESAYAEKMSFLRKLAGYWKPDVGAQYLAYGRLLRPLTFDEPRLMPVMSYPASRRLQREGHENLVVDALLSGVFRATDGSFGVFIVNVTERPIPFRFELTPDRYPVAKTDVYVVTRVAGNGERGERTRCKGKIAYDGKIPGRDVVFLEAKRQETD